MGLFLKYRYAIIGSFLLASLFGLPGEAHVSVFNGKAQQTGMLTRLYYQMAVQLAAQGNLGLSTEMMERAYRINPQSKELALGYVGFLQAQGDYEKTISVCQSLLKDFKQPELQSEIYYFISLTYDRMNRSDKAIEHLEKAIQLWPDSHPPARYYYDLGVLYAKMDLYEKTRDYSKRALELAPEFAEAWNNFGFSLAKLGLYNQGYEAIARSLHLNPKSANTLDSMGYVLFKMGHFKESVIEYEKAVELDPGLADSFLYLGKSYEAEQRWEKALQAYEKFLELSDDNPESIAIKERVRQLKGMLLLWEIISPASLPQGNKEQSHLEGLQVSPAPPVHHLPGLSAPEAIK